MQGRLFIVGTPIGNLEDITLRALRVLKEADVVACEDTRVTKKLLSAHGIDAPLLSYHARSGEGRTKEIINLLAAGKKVALVSDAGTPAISDPGGALVAAARTALGEDVRIEAIPGPSAAIAALSIAGIPASEFVFLGFLPHKKGRETLFKEITESERTVVFYESTHRIMKTLERLSEVLAPDRTVAVVKELTKIHERVFSGTASDILQTMLSDVALQKGEFVVIVVPR